MPVKITILGSGTGVPSLERSSCSVLMETSGARILFDIGAGTMRRLLEAGRTISEITHIFISHFHTDHTGELASFLFATKNPESLRRRTPFTLAGARGLRSFYEALVGAYGHWIELPDEIIELKELSNTGQDSRNFGQFKIETLPMRHIDSSIGYRLTAPDGCVVVYTGDTDYTDNVIELGRGADMMICESAMPDELKIEKHLTPFLAGELAARAGVKELVLTHFYPETQNADIEAECRKTYSGPLALARDLMTFQVEKGRNSEMQTKVENFIEAYNNFDIETMTGMLHRDIIFENYTQGKKDFAVRGIPEFRGLAEKSRAVFKERRQEILNINFINDQAEAEIIFEGVFSADTPDGMGTGDTLKLHGTSVYRFKDGLIIYLADYS